MSPRGERLPAQVTDHLSDAADVMPAITRVSCCSAFNVVTPKGICRTGRVHVYFRCRRLCERVFTAFCAIFRVQERRKKKHLQCGMNMMENV